MVIWWRPPVQAGSFEEEETGPEVAWRPDLDIFESSLEYRLIFDVPGVRPHDLEVSLIGRTLTVEGTRRVALPRETVAHLLEGPRGPFARRLRLPVTADLTGMQTALRDGQLVVQIPKRSGPAVAIRIGVSQP
jgi:HSP20 family protein